MSKLDRVFTIEGKLPSLNDVIAKNRTNRYVGADFKKKIETSIGWAIKKAKLKPIETPCVIEIEWHEATKRRDVDNIHSSVKFILDALVKNGILKNDSRRYVKQIYHEVIDDTTDFVVVKIKECEV